MKNAIILHGAPEKEHYYDPKKPSESNAHWLPWLQKELLIRNIAAATPEIPRAYEPHWELWCREVGRFDIGPETILVGHSAGAGFWVKYLSLNRHLRVGRVVLVAPWLDPDHTFAEETFLQCEPDQHMAARTQGVIILSAPDDGSNAQASVAYVMSALKGVELRTFPAGYGHFTYENLGTTAFPELLEIVLGR